MKGARRANGIECVHPVAADHSEVENGRRVWRCTGCRKRARWGEGWRYFGALECRACGFADVAFVVCSDACADTLEGKP